MDLLARTLLALAVCALLFAPHAFASHTQGRCRGGETLSQNSVARLYGSGPRLVGCMWSRNEPMTVDTDSDDFTITESWLRPRLGGRFAAWTHHTSDQSCKADCPPGYDGNSYSVMRADLKSRDIEEVPGRPAGSTLRVNKRGAVTWLQSLGGGRREVHAWDGDGHRVLGTGSIRRASYSLRGSTLRWTDGDVAHVVTLR